MIATLILPMLLQSAEPPVPGWNCEDPIAQQEMNWCAGQDYAAADAELNAQWKITAALMKALDTDFAADETAKYDNRPGYFQTLLEAQRAWLRYRDAHCRVSGYEARGGSMEPLLAFSCKADLTKQRTQQLRDLAETH